MKTLILVTIIAVTAPQTGSGAAAGSWTAEFNGKTFVRLDLGTVQKELSGSLTMGDIEVDKQGDLRQVKEPSRDPAVIFDVVQQGATVTFSWKDGDNTDRFEFRILNDTRGELRLILTDELRKELAADGLPVPKPIVLTRQTRP